MSILTPRTFLTTLKSVSLLFAVLLGGCSPDLKITTRGSIQCAKTPELQYCKNLEEQELKNLKTLTIDKASVTPSKVVSVSTTVADPSKGAKDISARLSTDPECKTQLQLASTAISSGLITFQDVPEGIYYVCVSGKTTIGTEVAALNDGVRTVVDFTKPNILASAEIIASPNGDLPSDLKIIDISNVSLNWILIDDSSGAWLEASDTMLPKLGGASNGTYTAMLTATDEAGNTSSQTFKITWNNQVVAGQSKPTAPSAISVAAYSNTTSVTASYTSGAGTNFSTHNVKACTASDCSTGCLTVMQDLASPVTVPSLVAGNAYFICLQSVDLAANTSAYVASGNSVTIDTTNPSIPTSPGFAGTYSTSTTVNLAFSASTDTNFSTHDAKVCASNDCTTGCLSTVQSPTSPISLSGLTNGSAYYGCVRGVDLAGNSTAFAPSLLTVTIDTTAPTGTIALAATGGYANTQSPAITLTRDADVAQYQLCSNTATVGNNCTGVLRAWAAYAASPAAYNFGSDGSKTLYVQFRDNAGNIGATVISNTVTVDTTTPTVPSAITVALYRNATSVDVTYTEGTDTNISTHNVKACTASDCITACLSVNQDLQSPVTVGSLVSGTAYYICLQTVDLAANTSAYVASGNSVTIDTTAPGNPSAVSVPSSASSNFNISFTAGTELYPSSFNIKACTNSDCASGCVGATTTAASPGTISSAALGNGTSYYGCVRGTDLAGNSSSWVASSAMVAFSQRTVTYNGNGNTGGSAPTDGGNYWTGQTVTALGNTGSLVKTSYVFAGWNTAADGSGTNYLAGSSFAIGAANVTLYAHWILDCSDLTGGWVAVPGDSVYGTSDFCAMKFEAKNVSSVATSTAADTPWVNINQIDAQSTCQALGANMHLITNNEWMTLASNIASTASNWSGGTVGSGSMNQGHSDNSPGSACAASTDDTYAYVETDCTPLNSGTWSQKRTHTLSTGAVIWDTAGNVWDWTSYVISNNSAKPYVTGDGSPQNGFRELTAVDAGFTVMTLHDLRPINAEKPFWTNSWNSNQGAGQYWAGGNGSGGVLSRGARWADPTGAGVFAADLNISPTFSNSYFSFRCARSTYKVIYKGNSDTGGSAPTDASVYSAGDTVTVLGNTGSLVRAGYTFAGWNTAADGSGTTYAGGATFAVTTSNTTLYAQWTLDCSDLGADWVVVPGDSVYGTSDFCAMKFEAKNVGSVATSQAASTPWVNIDQNSAQTACQSLGSNVHLITNNEWMSLASNIANVGSNWSGSTVGSGAMNRGHSDNNPGSACAASTDDTYAYVETDCTPLNSGTWSQKRTHTLSTGAVIWDTSGNIWDWTSYVISNNSAKPYVSGDGSPQGAYRQLSAVDTGFTAMTLHDLRPINSEKSFWTDSWNSTQSAGQYWAGSNGVGGALIRGAYWGISTNVGVFAARLDFSPTSSGSAIGFRCTRSTYKVTYSANASSGGSAPTDATVYSAGGSVTVQGNTGLLLKTGYIFAGWNTAADGSGTNYQAGDTLAITAANVTLYAKWTLACSDLPGNWVLVPADSVYGTADTCVMKFEAKNVSSVATSQAAGDPWVNITQTAAITACQNVGANVHLITNNEWMALASNIANVNSNWSGGTVGSGAMNRGHSDNSPGSACAAYTDDTYAYVETNCTPMNTGTFDQKRTHTLSTGAVIWDIGGNVWDWTSYVISNNSAKPYVSGDGSPQGAWRELSAVNAGFTAMTLHDLRPTNSEKSFWTDSWNSSQAAGQYYAGSNGSGGALLRGAAWGDGTAAGVFAASLSGSPTLSASSLGFRCARAASP